MQTLSLPRLEPADQAFVDEVIAAQGRRPGAMLKILEAVQEHNRHKYLPLGTLGYISWRTGIPRTIPSCSGKRCHSRSHGR